MRGKKQEEQGGTSDYKSRQGRGQEKGRAEGGAASHKTDLRQGQRPDLPSRDNGALSFWWPGRSMPRARRPGIGDRGRMEDPRGTWAVQEPCLGQNSHLLENTKPPIGNRWPYHHHDTVTPMLENLNTFYEWKTNKRGYCCWLLSKFKENQWVSHISAIIS